MKPLKLKLKGLNSFIEEQTIDFEKLTERGLFGIFGPTGSGKSTILDGITLCLYGEVARKSTNFINTNGDSLYVSYEFQITNAVVKRYRVEREFKRDKYGSNRTKSARIMDITNGDMMILEEQIRQVTNKCEEIIGLNLDDFTRTVVLPQGKFSEFLKLQGKERRDMLERLFNLRKYGDDLSQKLAFEIRSYKTEESKLIGQLKGYEDISDEILQRKNNELECIEVELERSTIDRNKMEENYNEAKELWSLLEELVTHTRQLTELKRKDREITSSKEMVQMGFSANAVKPFMDSYHKIQVEIVSEENKLRELQEQFNVINHRRLKALEDFKVATLNKEEKLPKLNQKQMQLEDACKIKEALDILVKEQGELSTSLSALQENIEKSSQENSALRDTLEILEQEIQQQEEEVEKKRVSLDFKAKVEEALSLEQKMNDKIKSKTKIENDLKNINTKIEGLQKDYSQFQSELNLQIESNKTISKEYKQLLESCPGDHEVLLKSSDLLHHTRQNWKDYNEYSRFLNEQEKNRNSIINKIKEKSLQKEELTSKIRTLQNKVEDFNRESDAQILRADLKEGDPCPVCGSHEHKIDSIVHMDLTQLNNYKEQLDIRTAQNNEIDREITTLEANRLSVEKSIKEIKVNIEKLGNDFLNTKIEVIEAKFKKLQENIDTYNKDKVRLEESQNDRKEAIRKLDVSISATKASLSDSQELKQKYINDINMMSKELKKDTLRLEEYKKELKIEDLQKTKIELTKMEKETNDLQSSLKKLRETFSERQKYKDELFKALVDLKESYTGKKVALEEKTSNIKAKEAEIINKVGYSTNLIDQLNEVIKNIENISNTYIVMEKEKNESIEAYDQCNNGIMLLQNSIGTLKNREKEEKINLDLKIKEQNFQTIEQVKLHIISQEEMKQLQKRIDEYNGSFNKLEGAMDSIHKKINGRSLSVEEWKQIQIERENKNRRQKELEATQTTLTSQIKEMNRRLEVQQLVLKEKEKIDSKLGLLNDLEKLFKGKRFVEYVATHQLQYVSMEASKKLKEITGGNYGLEVDENGKFLIRDYKNGGAQRDATTLSGGETFLASLALALSLSAQIQLKGTAPLELFFLDEGFGTLDDTLLEVVMDSLETIHHEKLSIGIISHVESIKNRVPIKLMIQPSISGLGGSKVKIEYS